MEKRYSRSLGMFFLLAGACFLIDPFVRLFDVIPDCIGFWLMMKGVSCLSDLNRDMADVKKQFGKLALLAAARLLVIPFVYGYSSVAEQGMECLLFTFVFAVLNAILVIPAVHSFGQGMSMLASFHGGTAVLKTVGNGNRSRTDVFMTKTVIFLLFRECMAILPELTILGNVQSGEDGTGVWSQAYQYIDSLRIVCGALVLLAGVIWLVNVFAYARHIRRDADFMYELSDAYALLHMQKPHLFTSRIINNAMTLYPIAFLFTVTLFADGYAIVPDALCAVCILIGTFMIRKLTAKAGTVMTVSALFIPLNILSVILQSRAMHGLVGDDGDNFTLVENAARLTRDPSALADYQTACLTVFISQICMIALLWVLRELLNDIIEQYTGVVITDSSQTLALATRAELKRKITVLFIFGTVLAILPVAYMYGLPYAQNPIRSIGNISDFAVSFVHTVMESLNIIDTVCRIVWIVCAFRIFGEIKEEINQKYLMAY